MSTSPVPDKDAISPLADVEAMCERLRYSNRMLEELAAQQNLTLPAENVFVDVAAMLQSLSKDAERYRMALDRIIGLCGDSDRCACGRPTGILAIVSCAKTALAAKEQT